MELVVRHKHDVTMIALLGSMTLLDPPGQLKVTITERLDAGDRRFVLNMGGLTFVDSSCIGELMSSSLAIARAGGALKLSQTSRRLEELLLVTRLSHVFERYDTDAAAIASFGHDAPH